MGVPMYTTTYDDLTLYHVINWPRHGTWCDKALNQDFRYYDTLHKEAERMCEKCARLQGYSPLEWEEYQEPDVV